MWHDSIYIYIYSIYIYIVRIRCSRQGIQRHDTRVLFWYVGTNVSEDSSALTMEAVWSSEIITFTYHVTTRCNNVEALCVYRQFIGLDLVFFLPLEMRVLLKRSGSVETPATIELHSTNGLYILGNCLLLITAIARRLSRQTHKYDASTLLYSSGWKSVRSWLWRRVTYGPCAAC
jgi:hypothetical protein